jgi:hypothetical protein
MTRLSLLLLPLLLLTSLAGFGPGTETGTPELSDHSPQDEAALQRYVRIVLEEFFDIPENATEKQIQSMLAEERMAIKAADVTYAPDSALKIFVVEIEGCGAVCNSEWFSWVHYDLHGSMKVAEAGFSTIEKIHLLEEGRYLVISRSHARPASVLTVFCMNADMVAIRKNSIQLPDDSSGGVMGFCQENAVAMEMMPYLTYDEGTGTLEFLYANNFAHSHDMDVDSIFSGRLRYADGGFTLEEDSVVVVDRRR